jgi:hypothetical protein
MPIVAGIGVGVTDLTETATKNCNDQNETHLSPPGQTFSRAAFYFQRDAMAPVPAPKLG